MQIQQVERLQVERMREFHEVNRLSMDQPRDEVPQVGLLRAKNCTGKFETALDLLDMLTAQLERGENYADADEALKGLFGPKPTRRGSMILDYFHRLKQGEEFLPPDESDEPSEAEADGNSHPGHERRVSIRAALIQWLLEKRHAVSEEYEIFLREHMEVSPAVRDACLAPSDARWTWILRLDNYLDRQIERKLRMLLRLQALRLKAVAGRRPAERRRRTCLNTHEKKILKTSKRTHQLIENKG